MLYGAWCMAYDDYLPYTLRVSSGDSTSPMTHRNRVWSSCRDMSLSVYVLLLRWGESSFTKSTKVKRGSVVSCSTLRSCWIKIGGSRGKYGEQANIALPPSNTTSSPGGLRVKALSAEKRELISTQSFTLLNAARY